MKCGYCGSVYKLSDGHTCSNVIERKHYESMKCHAEDLERECERLHAEIERVKRNHGCARNQGTTQFCHEALDAHKETDALRADAALGRAVRKMVMYPRALQLFVGGGQWCVEEMILTPGGHDFCEMKMMHNHTEDQPEAAMRAAGLMEGEEK